MAFKAILVCASALLVQNISGQYLRNVGIATDGYGFGLTGADAHAGAVADANAGAFTGAHAGAIADARAGVDIGVDGIGLADRGLGWRGLGLHADRGLDWHGDNGLGWHGVHGRGWHGGHDVVLDDRLGLDLGISSVSKALPITSKSPISPTGISVVSENAIEGALAVTGKLPFLSAVAVDGGLATAGSGAVAYDCADGRIGIDHFIGDNFGYGHNVGLVQDAGIGMAGYGLNAGDLRLDNAGWGLDAAKIGLGPRARAFY